MTRFPSPALRQLDLRLPAIAVRGLLGAAAVGFTAMLWLVVGAQAGQFGDRDTTPRTVLEPVVVFGQRPPPAATLGMGAPADKDCARRAALR